MRIFTSRHRVHTEKLVLGLYKTAGQQACQGARQRSLSGDILRHRLALKERSSVAVCLARNGREALEILEGSEGDTIDVILTDNLMPEVGTSCTCWQYRTRALVSLYVCQMQQQLSWYCGAGQWY